MSELGALALRLSEATDISTAAERLAEHLRELAPGAGARVYLLAPGDKCGACPRAERCPDQDFCFHLEASLGEFSRPVMLDQRVPRGGTSWGRVYESPTGPRADEIPPELEGPADGDDTVALMLPLEAGGETVGVAGLRVHEEHATEAEEEMRIACFLTATAIRLLRSLSTASRRYESLLMVNELGRKVNSILNDELLLRQAAVDVHRTFGFHNVMIFMVDEERSTLELKAQASRYASPIQSHEHVAVGEGVIGHVYQTGRTEIIDDVTKESSYVRWYADTKSEMAVPIQIGGVIEGVLNVESDVVGGFGTSDRLVLETVANQLAIAIENARLFGMVKEREDRYRTLVESSPGAVLHLDSEGHLIYANPATTDVTGYSKRELLANFKRLEDLTADEGREDVQAAVEDSLRGESRPDLEFPVRHADGGQRWVIASLQPLRGEQGDLQGVVVLARDRTREKELQNQLNQSEKLSAIGTLVSGVAHELNNPLAGILGFAQLLLARSPDDWGRGDIENIEINARRCQRIVENLLAFARQSRMTKRRANLNEVIDSVLNLNEYQFRMDNIEIERDLDSSIPLFPIDVNRWQQVFINLANNAHQALLASKTAPRRIRFHTRSQGDAVEIRVHDNGPGIPPDVRKHIFDPFFTTKESGTGLGLGICFGIVEEHGGTITLDESVETGACFVISVPVAEARVFPVELPGGPRKPSSNVGAGQTVLIVDDDTYVCDVVARVLQNHDYTTEVANDGEQALRMLAGRSYDLVVTDVRMPGDYDGIDIHDKLIAHDPEANRRMVFMTGNLLDGRTMERLQALHVCCVEKPFDIHALAESVNEVGRNAADVAHLTLKPQANDGGPPEIVDRRPPPEAAAG
ncbi:MAG: PAS domain S-box protein [Planctomycetota bacterium]|nr:PAS domain S-box protein [Planctomycetota bacterium]